MRATRGRRADQRQQEDMDDNTIVWLSDYFKDTSCTKGT